MDETLRPTKEPWLAATLSLIFPGLGQIYNGQWRLGIFFFSLVLLLSAGILFLLSPWGNFWLAIVAVLVLLGLTIASLVHAHRSARRGNSAEAETCRKQIKDPWLAVFLTQFVPGLGHFYLGRWIVGIVLLIGALAIWGWPEYAHRDDSWTFVLHLAGVLYLTLATWLACRAGPPSRRPTARIIGLLILLILADKVSYDVEINALRSHVLKAYFMGPTSMSPTIEAGENVLVWKWRYQPQRGDVILFRPPIGVDLRFAHRLVAFGGETVEIRDGGLFINGQRLTGEPWANFSWQNLEQQKFAKAGTPYTVPEDCVFVLGDNSGRSNDSRFFGGVPNANIEGKVYQRYSPFSRVGRIK